MRKRREHLPSPVKQKVLSSSPLKGMERPTRSFKSFIQNFSPHPGFEEDKPLPPVPTSSFTTTLAPSISTGRPPRERLASVTSWKAPADWDNLATPDSERKTSPFCAARRYSPLLPEPSPEVRMMQVEPKSRPCDLLSLQQSRSKSEGVNECVDQAPIIPPKHPHRISPLNDPLLAASGCSRASLSPNDTSACAFGSYQETSLCSSSQITPASNKRYGWDPLRLETSVTCDSNTSVDTNSPVSPLDDEVIQVTGGVSTKPSIVRGPIPQDVAEDVGSERLQRLSVSQDYHEIVADQYHDAGLDQISRATDLHDELIMSDNPEVPNVHPQPTDLVPRPLSWIKPSSRRTSDVLSPATNTDTELVVTPRKRPRKRSWMHFTHLQHGVRQSQGPDGRHSRSVSDSSVTSQSQIPDTEVDRILTKETHLPHFLPRLRGFRQKHKRVKMGSHQEVERTPTVDTELRPSTSPTPGNHTELVRLPGGFALIRRVPTSDPQSRSSSYYDHASCSMPNSQQREDSASPSVDSIAQRRSSSIYTESSQGPVAPTVAINRALRTTESIPSSLKSSSNHSSSPSSPLAQEITLSRTPPPHSSHAQPYQGLITEDSSQSNGSRISSSHKRSDSATEEGARWHGLHFGILEKARDKRDAWRKHQEQNRHDQLKKSIRLVGPADPGPIAGYINRTERMAADVVQKHEQEHDLSSNMI